MPLTDYDRLEDAKNEFHGLTSEREEREDTLLLVTDNQTHERGRSCNPFRASKLFLVLFFLGTVCVVGIGLTVAVHKGRSSDVQIDEKVAIAEVKPNTINIQAPGETDLDYPNVPEQDLAHSAFGEYRFAAVATDAPECSTLGTEALVAGGSAVDAAIVSLFCVGVLNPHNAGIGGGLFMLIYDAERNDAANVKTVSALDAREPAPSAATLELYGNDTSKKSNGPLSIGIPNEIRGYYEAWSKYGKLPWSRLVEPSIKMCEEGFVLREAVANVISKIWDKAKDQESWRELFVRPDGALYGNGDTMKNTRLAGTLQKIADDPEAFYQGQLAEDILADLKDAGSIITSEDLTQVHPIWKVPSKTYLSSLKLNAYSMPPPSSGPIYHLMLNIMLGYQNSVYNEDTYHRIAETFKFGFAERTYLGDPDFVDISQYVERWNRDEYISELRSRIDDQQTHDVPYYNPATSVTQDSGTCHLSVLAADGSAVAATSTINGNWGSYIRGSRTGIIFNNEMDDFNMPGPPDSDGLSPSEANFIAPGKRPVSSMVPTIMVDDEGIVRLIIGASGSKRILTSTTYVTLHNLWMGYRIDEAVDMFRLHHTLSPNVLEYEKGFSQKFLDDLAVRGHQEKEATSHAVCQAIHNTCKYDDRKHESCIHATSDRRKQGAPDGY